MRFLRLKKVHGPKHPPPGHNLGPKLMPHVGRSDKKMTVFPSIYKVVHDLIRFVKAGLMSESTNVFTSFLSNQIDFRKQQQIYKKVPS